MKRVLALFFYVAILGIMLYAGIQLYRPSIVVRAGSSCCSGDPQCGPHEICENCGINCCPDYGNKNCGEISQ